MSLLRPDIGDDVDELVREWMACGDEAKKRGIAESHYWHRSSLSHSDRPMQIVYGSLCTAMARAEQGRNQGRYHQIYWEVKGREDGKKVDRLLKGLAIIVGVVIVFFTISSIAKAPRTPEHILRQRHPYDPADDPRSDSGGYRARGL